jgi:hypothetical protein
MKTLFDIFELIAISINKQRIMEPFDDIAFFNDFIRVKDKAIKIYLIISIDLCEIGNRQNKTIVSSLK